MYVETTHCKCGVFLPKWDNKERGWKPIVLLFLWSLFTFCFIYFERVCVYLFNYDCIKSREWCISYLFILFFSSFGLPFWFNRNVKPSLEKDKNVVPIPVGYDKKSPYSIALLTKNGLLPINNPQRGVYILGDAGSGKTRYILEPILYEMIRKGYCGLFYDYDFEGIPVDPKRIYYLSIYFVFYINFFL